MKLSWILAAAVLLIGLYVPCEGFLSAAPLQDFIDKYVDIEKFKEQGIQSLNSTAIDYIWNYFKTKFQRHYTTTEEEKARIRLFRQNLKSVLESNIGEKHPFKLALNEFADMTKQEFLQLKTGLRVPSNAQESVRRGFTTPYPDDDDSYPRGSTNSYQYDSDSNSDDEDSYPRGSTNSYQYDSDSNGDDEDSYPRGSTNSYQDDYYGRRLKRNIHRRRNHNRRFFSDWWSNWFNNDKDKDDKSTPSTDSFDWRTKGVVTGIKNQGQCGSCYAFASAAVIESIYAIKTKSQTVTEVSPQQIVDCSSGGNLGCNGGLFDYTINYLQKNGGKIATDKSYPYVGKQQTCKTSGITQVNLGTIKYTDIKVGDEKSLADSLVKYGPMFIGLHVSINEFMYYKAGIIKVANCPNGRANIEHALTLVGYGYDTTSKQAYWIIKNSWGTSWGENGYVRLAKDAGNMCGITSLASYATLT